MFVSTRAVSAHPTVRRAVVLRRLTVLVLALAMLLPAQELVQRGRSLVPAASSAPVADLPLDAQAAISAALGRDDARYHAVAQAGGVQLANPNHGLRADFAADGLTLHVGTGRGTLALRGYGYGAALQPVAAAPPVADANRVSYTRGALREWYLNGPFGLEQGFTLAQAPAGPRSGPLALALALTGWQATLDPDGTSAQLTTPTGTVLRYSGLLASDATGRALPAWLERHGTELWLRVQDAGARYPLLIDPFIQQAKLTASDGATGNGLGTSVAISGDTVVVGTRNSTSGSTVVRSAVYVYVKSAGGWASATQTAKLTASDGVPGDTFGYAVAIDGDTIVAGARAADIGGNRGQGAAYVYVKPAGGWASATQTAKLTASDGGTNDHLGISVAIDGDTIVAGAEDSTVGGNIAQGATYVYIRPAGGWASATETARLTASDGAQYDGFGYAVAIDGDTIVAGATAADIGGNRGQGAAYVYVRPAGGWASATQTAKLTASDGALGDTLGYSVAIDGDTVVAGAERFFGEYGPGAAYVYVRPTGGWASATETAKLTASNSRQYDGFGADVAVNGDTIVAGVPKATIGGNQYQGAAYVYVRPTGGWASATETAKLTAADGAQYNTLGGAIAIDGDTVVAGASNATIGGIAQQGAAYVFRAPDTTAPTITITTPAAGAVYTRGQVINAAYTCTEEDGDAGLAACTGTVPTGSPIDTSALGAKDFTVNATDGAGNTTARTHTYTVVDVPTTTPTQTPTATPTQTPTATPIQTPTRTPTATPTVRGITINMPRPTITAANLRNYPVGGACEADTTVTVTVGTLSQTLICAATDTYITYTNATSLPDALSVAISARQRTACGAPVGTPATVSTTTVKDTVGPSVTISTTSPISTRLPTFTGTTAATALVIVIIDLDNTTATTTDRVVYRTTATSSGQWSVNLSTATPTSGVLPAGGLPRPGTISLGAVARDQYNNEGTPTSKRIVIQ